MNSLNLGHMLGCGLNGAKESFDAGNNKTGYLKCMPVIGGIVSLIIRASEGQSLLPTWEGRCFLPNFGELAAKNKAATLIQSIGRGMLGNGVLTRLKKAAKNKEAAKNKAATLIQSIGRGMLGKGVAKEEKRLDELFKIVTQKNGINPKNLLLDEPFKIVTQKNGINPNNLLLDPVISKMEKTVASKTEEHNNYRKTVADATRSQKENLAKRLARFGI